MWYSAASATKKKKQEETEGPYMKTNSSRTNDPHQINV
jgi:hypothetical protein